MSNCTYPFISNFTTIRSTSKTRTATNSLIYFQVQELFPEFVFSTNCHPPCIIQICTGLTNSNSPLKAMTSLSVRFHHCITTSNPTIPEPNTPPCPPCKMFPLLLSSQILIGLPYLPHHNPSNQLYLLHTDTANKVQLPLHVPLRLPLPLPASPKPISVPSPTKSVTKVFPKPKLSCNSCPGKPRSKTSLDQLSPCHLRPKPISSQPKLKFSCPSPSLKSNPTPPRFNFNPIQPNAKTNPTQQNQKPNPTQPVQNIGTLIPL